MKTMSITTLLNEGVEHKQGNVNIRGSLKEAFEEGQPELDMDMTAASGKGIDLESQKAQFESYGQKMGAKYASLLMSEARRIIRNLNATQSVDMNANAKVYGMEEEDLIMEDDRFFDVVAELSNAFIDGLEIEWPFPFRDE